MKVNSRLIIGLLALSAACLTPRPASAQFYVSDNWTGGGGNNY